MKVMWTVWPVVRAPSPSVKGAASGGLKGRFEGVLTSLSPLSGSAMSTFVVVHSVAVSHRGQAGGTRTLSYVIGHLDARRISTASWECGPLGSERPLSGSGA